MQGYLDVLAREWELYNEQPAIAGRPLNFVYFGGGTPSYLSVRQLEIARLAHGRRQLVARRRGNHVRVRAGHAHREQAGRAFAGSASRVSASASRTSTIAILEANGRAHRSPEIGKAYEFARSLDFPQINIDLIAGMLGETDDNWRRVRREDDRDGARQRHHLPDGAAVQHDHQQEPAGGGRAGRQEPVANWSTKRRWVEEAFEALERAGYIIGSAYTAVKSASTKFVYRDRLWQGADMVGLGVASFGYVNGVHMQNLDTYRGVLRRASTQGVLPLAARSGRPTRKGSSASSSCSSSSARSGPRTSPPSTASMSWARFREQLAALE